MTLKTASVLAFERKLDPSDALFHAGNWVQRDTTEGWQAVSISEKSVRGTISNRLKAKDQDPAKLDAAIENPNLQKVDVAALPSTADTLKVYPNNNGSAQIDAGGAGVAVTIAAGKAKRFTRVASNDFRTIAAT